MKFDRNTVIGFVILAALFVGYFVYTNKEQQAFLKEKQRTDSIAAAAQRQKFVADSIARASQVTVDPIQAQREKERADSLARANKYGHFQAAAEGAEQKLEVKNNVFTIVFTNKGGQPDYIELNKFKNKDSGMVKLASSDFDRISYKINTGSNIAETGDLFFKPGTVTRNSDGSQTVSFVLASSDSSAQAAITHEFVIRPDEYMIDFNVKANGTERLFSDSKMNLTWQYSAAQQESDISFEKQNTQVGYVEDGDFDYHTIGRRDDVEFDTKVKWIGIRQRFFNTFFVSNDQFSNGKIEWVIPPNEKEMVVQSTANMVVPVAQGNSTSAFRLFYGPADFNTLRKYDLKLDKMINLGQGPYAFVRPLNRFIVIPVWDFIKGFGMNFGWVIAFLTLFIRLVISPLTYKSYLSGAKMKALRPEIATLKAKHGNDQQAMSMDQMKLFREAGVNPLGGCIPALLQIPIFFALYSFFNSSVDLRGAEFLWSKDLSAYDAVINFGFKIPLLGNHLSLFTLTAVITSLLISIYSMSMTPDQSNPVLKYMPYIFPIFLLFIFNNLPSALTWYYTVSNLITLILQFVIQNYIIDHDKILAKIQENRKKPRTKSKWQERMEQMQEQQKKLKEMQQKRKN